MKHLILALTLICFLTATAASAATWKIEDNYTGKYFRSSGDNYAQNNGDVISASSQINKFDIDNMIVDIDNSGNVTITITTDYDPDDIDIASLGTDFGDLFISTDGWNPKGPAPYNNDMFNNTGTDWEYVFDTDAVNFYKTSDGAYLLSQDFHGDRPDSWYRKKQLVQIDANKDDALIDQGDPLTFDDDSFENALIYSGFNLSDMGLNLTESHDLAFRWAMTCANDVIEGDLTWQPVPEPGTMMLFGLGLLGLGVAGRRTLTLEGKNRG